MVSTNAVLFLDASPLTTKKTREANRKKGYAHAARKTHERRHRSLASAARALVQLNNMTAQVTATAPPVRKLVPTDPSYTSRCSTCSSRHTRSDHSVCSALLCHDDDKRRSGANSELVRSVSSRPDWTHADVNDLQFYLNVLGISVKDYSDSAFFNIVVPCLADFDPGTKNLVLAVASAHRGALTQKEGRCPDGANVQALERCNRAIHYLAKQPATVSPEVLQTSCLLLACLHMIQLNMETASTYIEAGQSLCNMNDTTRSQCRYTWARSVTSPERQDQYMKSSFGNIIASTMAKSAVEFETWSIPSKRPLPESESKYLTINALALRNPICDIHDLLGGLENIVPVQQQLMRNLSYTATIDVFSHLAQDLTKRFDDINAFLRATEPPDLQTRSAINTLRTAKCCYATSVFCQVFAGSEMAWDEHVGSFEELIAWPEIDLTNGGSEGNSPFVFLPFTSIIVKPLWFTAVHCRDPGIRRRAIGLLLKHHRNESGMDSWIAGQIGSALMSLEEGGRVIEHAADIRDCDRVILRGFDYDDAEEQFYLLYTYAVEIELPDTVALHRRLLTIKPDPQGVVRVQNAQSLLGYLSTLHAFIAQASIDAALNGYVKPIWYDGEEVAVHLPLVDTELTTPKGISSELISVATSHRDAEPTSSPYVPYSKCSKKVRKENG